MNKEKQNLVNLLSKIDQKQKELKQLKKEYKTAFSAISKSWKEQVSSTYPNLQPCNIGESVGLDVVYEGRELKDKLLFFYKPEDKTSFYTGHGVYKEFKKEDYDKAFDFFLKVVNAFTSC